MGLAALVVFVAVLALLIWLANQYLPEPPNRVVVVILTVILVVVAIVWLLRFGGLA